MGSRITATEFKAKCLALIDEVHDRGEPVTITKHGRVVARLIPAFDETARPWLALRGGIVTWHGDPFAPAVDEADVKALA
jgi:prevent-host-death family protein